MNRSIGLGARTLIFLVACVGGCVGSDAAQSNGVPGPAPTAAGPAAFDANSGAVEGVVTNEEAVPIVAAQLGLQLAGSGNDTTTTLSDAQGRFTFNNVPPGAYQLFAQQLGYQSAAKSVDVKAGEVTKANMVLVVIPVHTGYHETWVKEGYFQCSTQILGSTGPCGFIAGQNVTPVSSLFDTNHRAFVYPVGPGVMSAFNELQWTQNSFATGNKLTVTFSYQNRTTAHWYCNAASASPIIMHWERGDDNESTTKGTCVTGGSQYGGSGSESPTIPYDKGQLLRTFMNTGSGSVAGVDTCTASCTGAAYEQHFKVWFSIFYWDRAPTGFTALQDR